LFGLTSFVSAVFLVFSLSVASSYLDLSEARWRQEETESDGFERTHFLGLLGPKVAP